MDVDLEELAAIVELLDKTEFTDFQFEKGDLRIAVRRGGAVGDDPPTASTSTADVSARSSGAREAPRETASGASAKSVSTSESAPANSGPANSRRTPDSVVADGDTVVTAPMLGTFYRSPKPGEAPFVELGDKVSDDSVLCIVEAMKLMNSVQAGASGEITAILAEDGDLLDYEQPLFAIRPLA